MKKIIIAVLCASAFAVFTANANVLQYSATFENNEYVISGKAEEKDRNISFEVIDGTYSFGELNPSNYQQISIWEKQIDFVGGNVNFDVKIPLGGESKKYKIRMNGQDFTEFVEYSFDNVNSEDFKNVVSALKSNLTSYETFKNFVQDGENAFLLGCDKVFDGADKEAAMKIMYESIKSSETYIESRDEIICLWAESNLAALINAKSDINDYSEFTEAMGDDIKKWYGNAAAQNGATNKFSSLLKMSTYNKASEIENAIKKALVLTTVRYADGVANIGEILKDFSDITGISKSGEIEKYTKVAGTDYDDFDKFMNDFKNIKESGGSTSSGGGGGGSKSVVYPTVGIGSMPKEEDKINMKFIDLDTVPWAYEAISALVDKGIINGRSEEIFSPDDMILREEFVKLCVVLLNAENDEYINKFSDVTYGAWYEKYINIAFNRNICSGVENGIFGVGSNITRQDMAVMLYNLLKSNNVQLIKAQTEAFADDEQISDYAKEAVYALTGAGIINGVGDNHFQPQGNATRAQSAKVIFGAMKLLQGGGLNDE